MKQTILKLKLVALIQNEDEKPVEVELPLPQMEAFFRFPLTTTIELLLERALPEFHPSLEEKVNAKIQSVVEALNSRIQE